MKKYLVVMLVAVVLLSNFSVLAYATEGDEPIDTEIGDSANMVDDTDSLEPETSGGDDGGENSETAGSGSDEIGDVTEPVPDELPAPVTLDGATVNVSQESIDKIANAVSTGQTVTVTNKDGVSYSIPSFVVEQGLHSKKYFYYGTMNSDSSYNQIFVASDEPLYMNTSDHVFYGKKDVPVYFCLASGEEWKYYEFTNTFKDWDDVSTGGVLAYSNRVYYTNHDIKDYSTNSVVYASDVASSSVVDTITLNNGTQHTLYDGARDVWNDYDYKWVTRSGNTYYYYFSNGLPYFDIHPTSGELCFRNSDTYVLVRKGYSDYSGSKNTIHYISDLLWANFSLVDDSGNIVYQSDAPLIYKIYFDTGFNDLTFDSITSANVVIPVPVKENYRFDGWYLNESYTLPFDPATYTFYQDITLYAKWTPFRTVSFVTGIDDYTLDSVQVVSGEAYTPPNFAYSGFEYIGAFTDPDFKNQFVGGTVVNDDLTLYLRFEPIVYDFGSQLQELVDCVGVIQSQLWIILVVGLLSYIYKFFRMFF